VFQRTEPIRARARGFPIRSVLEVINPTTLHVRSVLSTNLAMVSMLPDWSPKGNSLVIDLCVQKRTRHQLEAVALHPRLRFACGPAAWSPDGRRVVEAGSLLAHRQPDSLCPGVMLARITWQPLVPNTTPVRVMKCPTREEEPLSGYVVPNSEVSASFESSGTKLFIYSRGHHREICVRI